MTDKGRILIADDDETFSSATAELLRHEGYECDCVHDGMEATAQLQKTHYHVLISDIKMPGNTNLELINDLPRLARGVPVILVTGYPTLRSAVRSIQLPVVSYLIKPVNFDELLAQVRKAMSRFQAYQSVQDLHQRIQKWGHSLQQLEYGMERYPTDVSSLSVETLLPLTLQMVVDCLEDLKHCLRSSAYPKIEGAEQGAPSREQVTVPTDTIERKTDPRIERLERAVSLIAESLQLQESKEALSLAAQRVPLEAIEELRTLSSREWEILHRLDTNQRVQTIARELFISPHTVRNHLKSVFRKVGVRSQPDLLAFLQTKRTEIIRLSKE